MINFEGALLESGAFFYYRIYKEEEDTVESTG